MHDLTRRLAPALFLLGLAACGELSDHDGPVCEALGDPGCPCTPQGECTDQGDAVYVCQAGLCEPAPCPAGTLGCPCDDAGACGDGLSCNADGACEEACLPGSAGCACRGGDTCDPNGEGQPQVCRDGLCQAPLCEPGSLDCVCDASGACATGGVCDRGTCVVNTGQTLAPPENPQCWTPCRGGELDQPGVGRVECDADGLIPGCIGDAVCVQGTCVVPGPEMVAMLAEGYASCRSDAECLPTQNCISGGCYSDCEVDGDCNAPRICHRKACRIPCTTADDGQGCQPGYTCATEDGMNGVCMPNAPPQAELTPPEPIALEIDALLDTHRIIFTKNRLSALIRLSNPTERDLVFTFDKVSHTASRQTEEETPLSWLAWAVVGNATAATDTLEVRLPAGQSRQIILEGADQIQPGNPVPWTGEVSLSAPGSPTYQIDLAYLTSPAGRWTGDIHYLANFGTQRLMPWADAVKAGDEATAAGAIGEVGNALVRRWWAFREGSLSLQEFLAVLNAIVDESWRSPLSREYCDDPNAACYLVDNPDGYSVLSDDLLSSPVPDGLSTLQLALNLRPRGELNDQGLHEWVGRIDSGESLQYPGNPGVTVAFSADPSDCFFKDGDTACSTPLRAFAAETVIGARYPTVRGDVTCRDVTNPADAGRFAAQEVPWLVPGFVFDSSPTPDGSGARSRFECRDTHQPLGAAASLTATNMSLNAGNPFPNGRPLRSQLELLDGALINGEQLFVLFRETLPELMPNQGPSVAYGFALLIRQPTVLEPTDFEGTQPPTDPAPVDPPAATCSDALLDTVLEGEAEAARADLLSGRLRLRHLLRLLDGSLLGASSDPLRPTIDQNSPEEVHYVCHETGYINHGPADAPLDCPPGSEVTYFAVRKAAPKPEAYATCTEEHGTCRAGEECALPSLEERCTETALPPVGNPIEGLDDTIELCTSVGGCEVDRPCPRKGACLDALRGWENEYAGLSAEARADHWFRPDPEYQCEDENAVLCDDNRSDLRDGKVFYPLAERRPVFRPLDQAINAAFRYKTRFKSRRAGISVGFAPEVCNGDALPYCYDPVAIEQIAERVDCLAHLYTAYFDEIPVARRRRVAAALERAYSYSQRFEPGRAAPTVTLGFETLYAELLIMMGDESYTSALSSRFDLAGQRVATFRGSLFEPDGIDLAGPAGYEMFTLYQAVQYYQVALDRLYAQLDVLGATLDPGFEGEPFVNAATTVSWFNKLIRASAQKARAWSKIAERYHGFGATDAAQRVVEKAYAAAYIESIFFAQLQQKVLLVSDGAEQAQVQQQIRTAQLIFKDALLTMQKVRGGLTDDVNVFGFPNTYVPFVALDPGQSSAFEAIMARAQEKLAIAAAKETRALEDRRQFDVDGAQFQAALTEIELANTAELAEVCGWFEVQTENDVEVWPATKDYAHLDDDERTRQLGDPCGLVGNGKLAEALIEYEKSALAMQQWRQRRKHLVQQIGGQRARVAEQCERILDATQVKLDFQTTEFTLRSVLDTSKFVEDALKEAEEGINITAEGIDCLTIAGTAVGTNCPNKAAKLAIKTAGKAAMSAKKVALEGARLVAETAIRALDSGRIRVDGEDACEQLQIDGKFALKGLLREMAELTLEGLQLQYDTQIRANTIQGLRRDAISIQDTLEAQKQLTIDIEAARNDPNVRIYRNDAVRSADRTFRAALREAWRATRVYEYYTNTSYDRRDQLPLVRMVANGDFPLDAYLQELNEAYFVWEEQYGNADLRVQVISIGDDVFQLPQTDKGQETRPLERARAFSAALASQPRDERGAYLIDLQTKLDAFSPLTHNHKIRFIEVELVGDDLGDDLGRIYVRQRRGVGFLRRPDGFAQPYELPARTAVVDVFFNGERPLSDALQLFEAGTVDIYRNERLRDRPAHHNAWQMVLNLADEEVNRDIRSERIEDIRLYLWYTDFTEQ